MSEEATIMDTEEMIDMITLEMIKSEPDPAQWLKDDTAEMLISIPLPKCVQNKIARVYNEGLAKQSKDSVTLGDMESIIFGRLILEGVLFRSAMAAMRLTKGKQAAKDFFKLITKEVTDDTGKLFPK